MIKLKGVQYLKADMVRRILEEFTAYHGDPTFYHQAHEYAIGVSDRFGVELDRTVGVMAALSPMTSWDLNKKNLETMLSGLPVRYLGKQLDKADKILFDKVVDIPDVLSGDKTVAFWDNIMRTDQSELVTVDRHASSLVLGGRDVNLHSSAYGYISDAFKVAAKELNMVVTQLQSAVWNSWRERKLL